MAKRSPENRAAAKTFIVEDNATGEAWWPGLTWSGQEAPERALQEAFRDQPDREWVLREIGHPLDVGTWASVTQ